MTPSPWRALANRRMLICVLTGFSSGLPLYLLLNLVPAWLKTEGLSLKAIGAFALIQFPYTWKFLWSPLLDRFALPLREGRAVPDGPYRLGLAIREGRLVFDIGSEAGEKVGEFHLSLGPFRQVVKDYFQICASYFDAVKRLPPAQIEAIDMARRGIHNEGARTLQERLEGKADLDIDTARRLFTLICVLHFGG